MYNSKNEKKNLRGTKKDYPTKKPKFKSNKNTSDE